MTEKMSDKKIVNRFTQLRDREKPNIITKIIKDDDGKGCHLVDAKVIEKYKYYNCDYCGKEIKIEKDVSKSTGGICKIPASMTGRSEILLALHNKCLKQVINEFKEEKEC